jgi:hypothetical protein
MRRRGFANVNITGFFERKIVEERIQFSNEHRAEAVARPAGKRAAR